MKPGAPTTGPDAVAPLLGSNRRPHGGYRTRFVGTGHHGDRDRASLDPSNASLREGRTVFRRSVVSPADVPRVLISGMNNAKIGRVVEKGAWAGMPIFTLTLEERATCPATCQLLDVCYGNAMPFARRHQHGAALIAALDRELHMHAERNPRGFAVRLHVLGDFYSVPYVGAWAQWMLDLPALHVWGYTARQPSTDIGELIAAMNGCWPERWAVRFSVAPGAPIEPMQVTTIWRQPDQVRQPEGSVCAQQFDKTATCGTCGLCWAPVNAATRIAFVGHGMNSGPRKQ